MTLTTAQGNALLDLARRSIGLAFEGLPFPPGPNDARLHEKRGAFVTLKKSGRLRGCIGTIESDDPLWETVARMAREAAFSDPRFARLEHDELDRVTIEVSALTRPGPVDDFAAIEPGRDGLIVTRGIQRGLLLPQVATEWGWDRRTFLQQTCVKAGLPPDAWKHPDTIVHSFSAEVFSE